MHFSEFNDGFEQHCKMPGCVHVWQMATKYITSSQINPTFSSKSNASPKIQNFGTVFFFAAAPICPPPPPGPSLRLWWNITAHHRAVGCGSRFAVSDNNYYLYYEFTVCLMVLTRCAGSACASSAECRPTMSSTGETLCCQDVRRGRQGVRRICDRVTPISTCIRASGM